MDWTELFRGFTSTSGITCIEIYAPNCGPCKVQRRVTEQLCETYAPGITFARIDGSKRNDLMQQWEVRAVPVFLIFVNDKLCERFLGPEPYKAIADCLDSIRDNYREAA